MDGKRQSTANALKAFGSTSFSTYFCKRFYKEWGVDATNINLVCNLRYCLSSDNSSVSNNGHPLMSTSLF